MGETVSCDESGSIAGVAIATPPAKFGVNVAGSAGCSVVFMTENSLEDGLVEIHEENFVVGAK
jgi:hypothetical protein